MPAALQWIGRDRLAVFAGLTLVTAAGWLALMHMNAGMTGSAAATLTPAPRPPPGVGFREVFTMWAAMMAAMMAPAAGPSLSAWLTLARRRQSQLSALPAGIAFLVGYMMMWLGYAVMGAAAQWLLIGTALLSPLGASANTWLSAGILAVAGLYQLTPLKRACASRCRSPLLQLMSGWRDGVGGALRLGFGQGRDCIECCWALMALMFVAGVMNLLWMTILTAFILAEKLVPAHWHLDHASGLLLLVAGGWLAVTELT